MDLLTSPNLTQLVTMLCLLSVAVERATAIFISIVQLDMRITNSKLNAAAKQFSAAIFGVLIYTFSEEARTMFSPYFSGLSGSFIIGLLASGGSGFWNQILKLVTATTTKISSPQ